MATRRNLPETFLFPTAEPRQQRDLALEDEIIKLRRDFDDNQHILDKVLGEYAEAQDQVEANSKIITDKDAIISLLTDDNQRLEEEAEAHEVALAGEKDRRRTAEKDLEIAKKHSESLREKIAILQKKVDSRSKDETSDVNSERRAAEIDQERIRSEANVKELQELVDFFKRNSERNSKRVSELSEKLEEMTKLL